MVGIYLIENTINGKSYIGQSVDIKRRWREHRNKFNENEDLVLYRAFNKYGIENFNFKILEECAIKELDDLEIHYIVKMNTLVPHGYNMVLNKQGSRLNQRSQEVKELLLNTNLTGVEIGERVGLTDRSVSYINQGHWSREDQLDYPLRKNSRKEYKCSVCKAPITEGAEKCLKCSGEDRRKVVERPDAKTLKRLLIETNFSAVGRKYGVSDNAIRKWCKAYGMSTKAKDYKIPR